jgi:allantoinase
MAFTAPTPDSYLSTGGRWPYRPMIDQEPLELPDQKRVALWIGLNIECWRRERTPAIGPHFDGAQPDPMNQGWAEYGPRVGIWRLMDGFDRLGIRASVLLNSDVCDVYPRIIEEGNKRDWIWLGHGKSNSRRQGEVSLEEEATFLKEMTEAIIAGTGRQPRGWLGPGLSETHNTPDLLAALGYDYDCDWCNDDVPYPIEVSSGRMISVPYAIELNDVTLLVGKQYTGRQLEESMEAQFSTLYEESLRRGARVMCIAIHPYLVGQPLYYGHFMRALEAITANEDVWVTTSDEVADWYYADAYAHSGAGTGS